MGRTGDVENTFLERAESVAVLVRRHILEVLRVGLPEKRLYGSMVGPANEFSSQTIFAPKAF